MELEIISLLSERTLLGGLPVWNQTNSNFYWRVFKRDDLRLAESKWAALMILGSGCF
jgi:hypothetical protein